MKKEQNYHTVLNAFVFCLINVTHAIKKNCVISFQVRTIFHFMITEIDLLKLYSMFEMSVMYKFFHFWTKENHIIKYIMTDCFLWNSFIFFYFIFLKVEINLSTLSWCFHFLDNDSLISQYNSLKKNNYQSLGII